MPRPRPRTDSLPESNRELAEAILEGIDRRQKNGIVPKLLAVGAVVAALAGIIAFADSWVCTDAEAMVAHHALDKRVTGNATHLREHDGKFDDVKEALQVINRNLRHLAQGSQARRMEEIE